MPTVKINKFDGINTYVDQNNNSLDIVRSASNIRFENGYVKVDGYEFNLYATPALNSGYTWETGIFTILTNDKLANNPIPAEYPVLLLIAKKLDGATYKRQVWFQEYPNGIWKSLGVGSPVNLTGVVIPQTFLDTDKDGLVKFVESEGVLKIFMPHDSFWFGRINRTLNYSATPTVINNFYFDRLSEPIPSLSENARLLIDAAITIKTQTDLNSLDQEILFDTTYEYKDNNFENNTKNTKLLTVQATKLWKEQKDRFYNLLNSGYVNGGTTNFSFLQEYVSLTWPGVRDGLYCVPKDIANYMVPVKDANGLPFTLPNVPGNPRYNPPVGNGFYMDYFGQFNLLSFGSHDWYQNYYLLTFDQIVGSTWKLQSAYKETITGWTSGHIKARFIITAVLDDITEVIIKSTTIDVSTQTNPFGYTANIVLPESFNQRLTRIKIYHKFDDELDFQLLSETNFLDKDTSKTTDLKLSNDASKGIYLTQNIGFAYDVKHPEYYRVLTAFKDIAIEKGYALAISQTDKINVYYCTVGGGKVQTDLFYATNIVQLPGVAFTNLITACNGKFIVSTNSVSYVISMTPIDGIPTFEIIDSMPFGGQDRKDIAPSQGGIFVNGKKGIFFTDGFKFDNIATPILDVVEAAYDTSELAYNPALNEIYWKPSTSNTIWRYRLNRAAWEYFGMFTPFIGDPTVNELLIDFDNNIAVLSDTGLGIKKTFSQTLYSRLIFNQSDLGEGNIDKVLNSLMIDFKGKLRIDIIVPAPNPIYTTNVYYPQTTDLQTSAYLLERQQKRMWIPIQNRKRFSKLNIDIYLQTVDTELYGIEIDFDVLKRGQSGIS